MLVNSVYRNGVAAVDADSFAYNKSFAYCPSQRDFTLSPYAGAGVEVFKDSKLNTDYEAVNEAVDRWKFDSLGLRRVF